MRSLPTAPLALSLAATALVLAPTADAQVAPPPAEKTVTEPFTPPPRPRPTATVPTTEQRAQQEAERAAQTARPARPELPDIEHGSLVQLDPSGKVRRLETSASVAALEINPMIDAETRPLVDEYIVERRKAAMARAVQYNDIARRVYNEGLIDTMVVSDRESLEETLGLLQPLSLPPAEFVLENELSVFDPVASEFNRKIANEYLAALQNEAIIAGAEGDTAMPDLVAREMFRDATRDVMAAYHRLMWTTAHLMAGQTDALSKISITAEQRDEVERRMTRVFMAATETQLARAAGNVFDVLTEEQQQELLAFTRENWRTRGEDL